MKLSESEIKTWLGREGLLTNKKLGMNVLVRVLAVRDLSYGRVDILVTPVAGSGERWVRADGVNFN